MKTPLLFFPVSLLYCLGGIAFGQAPKPVKNLVENGDFSGGASHWQGSGKVEVFAPGEAAKSGVPVSLPSTLKSPATPAAALPPLPYAATPAPKSSPAPFGAPGSKTDVNRVWCVTLNSKAQTFTQRFSVPRQAKLLRASFRVHPSPDFKTERTTLGAIQVRFQPVNSGFTFYDRQVPAEPQWKSMSVTYTLKEATRFCDFAMEVEPGEGQLFFDDFVIEALEH